MEIRTEKKLVEIMQTTNIYIAEDGKEFDNKIDCENYEKELESAKLRSRNFSFQAFPNTNHLFYFFHTFKMAVINMLD